MFCDVFLVIRLLHKPRTRRVSVGQSLLGRESFRGNKKEGGGGFTDPKDFDQLGGVDIGDKVHLQISASKGLEGFRNHDGPEVRASDADVHDVGNRLALVPFPRPGADLLGKDLHVLTGSLDLRHQVFALDDQGLIGRATESDMKDSTIFSEIDFIAAKHSISELLDFGLFEELAEEFKSFRGDAIL